MRVYDDPRRMPGTGEAPCELLARAVPLAGTLGQAYVERRGIPTELASAAGVRFDGDFGGRAAVIVALRDRDGHLASVHGRYLRVVRGQNKMLTIGPGNGMIGAGRLESGTADPRRGSIRRPVAGNLRYFLVRQPSDGGRNGCR